MKKSLIFGCLGLILAMASCSKENDFTFTRPYSLKALNVITTLEDGTTTVSEGVYTFNLTVTNTGQHGTITASNVETDPDMPLTFTTNDKAYSTNSYYAYFTDVTAPGVKLNNANFLMTPYFYTPGNYDLISDVVFPSDIVVAQYNIGESFLVRTFQENTFFVGQTNTTYPFTGGMQSYTTDDIYYMLKLNIEDNTADVILYNAKFTSVPQEPRKPRIDINGLSVTYSEDGITATGEDITPLMYEGGAGTPNENYIINNISFKTTDQRLSKCEITYKVAGMYNGAFSGSYVTFPD